MFESTGTIYSNSTIFEIECFFNLFLVFIVHKNRNLTVMLNLFFKGKINHTLLVVHIKKRVQTESQVTRKTVKDQREVAAEVEGMATRVVEFSSGGYKIKKIFA